MTIDISQYTPKKRRFLRERGRCCVYVVGPVRGMPSKIGIAMDIVARMSSIQSGNWTDMVVHSLVWTPGKLVALRVEERVHEILKRAGKWVTREWFNVPPEWAQKAIDCVVREDFPAEMRFSTHEQMLAYLQRQSIDRRDHEKPIRLSVWSQDLLA